MALPKGLCCFYFQIWLGCNLNIHIYIHDYSITSEESSTYCWFGQFKVLLSAKGKWIFAIKHLPHISKEEVSTWLTNLTCAT